MPGIEDWINNPLAIIDRMFASSNHNPTELLPHIVDYFEKKISNTQAVHQIPSINDVEVHNLPPLSLVKFRCMIQDMYDPELFFGAYECTERKEGSDLSCGMFRDLGDCRNADKIDFDSSKNVTVDRFSYYCISIPGENEWVKQHYSKSSLVQDQVPSSSSLAQTKRPCDDNEAEEVSMETESSEMEDASKKRLKTQKSQEEINSDRASASQSRPENENDIQNQLNLPIPDNTSKACIIKVYSSNSSLKLNDAIEVIGILSALPAVKCQDSGDEEDITDMTELDSFIPPSSLVPHLHAVVIKPLKHHNPYLPSDLGTDSQDIKNALEAAPKIREELLAIFGQILLGDSLAAEYLLCNILSSVYVRQEVIALGKFSLNLSKIPVSETYTGLLYGLLQKILVKSHFLPLSLTNLNMSKFIPHKDYEKNRLSSGLLQLSDHTHLVLDETALTPGQLNETGVKNLSAISSVVQNQRIEYDFKFHKMDYTTDIPVLVLSEGKSLIPCDSLLKLHPVSTVEDFDELFKTVNDYITEDLLVQIRRYISVLQIVTHSFTNDLQKMVMEEFVDMRKQNSNVTADDLHSLLVLARLVGLSKGETTLSENSWRHAREMEEQRKSRIL